MKEQKLNITTEQENNTTTESTQNYALDKENKSESGKMVKIENVEGTPFTIVTVETEDKNNSFIAIGTSRITKLAPAIQAKNAITKKDWGLIVSLVTIVTERVMEQIKLEDKARNELKEEGAHMDK
jgi:hypothetical protein